jgi:hypothetical protein
MSRPAVEACSTVETKTAECQGAGGRSTLKVHEKAASAFLEGENAGIASGHCGRERISRFA